MQIGSNLTGKLLLLLTLQGGTFITCISWTDYMYGFNLWRRAVDFSTCACMKFLQNSQFHA